MGRLLGKKRTGKPSGSAKSVAETPDPVSEVTISGAEREADAILEFDSGSSLIFSPRTEAERHGADVYTTRGFKGEPEGFVIEVRQRSGIVPIPNDASVEHIAGPSPGEDSYEFNGLVLGSSEGAGPVFGESRGAVQREFGQLMAGAIARLVKPR